MFWMPIGRTLRRKFAISTALGAQEVIEMIKTQGPFSVLVTDMHMPEINGVQLLTFAKKLAPNTVRAMLTGNAHQQTAIDAVNKGDIFRFLNKPCSPENLENTLNVALKQFHLINAEKDLLENTLKGNIETLTEVLSLINPQLFGKTTQLKNHIKECANALGLANVWEMENIAMLSMLGYVALPAQAFSWLGLSRRRHQRPGHSPRRGDLKADSRLPELFKFGYEPPAGSGPTRQTRVPLRCTDS